MPDKPANLTSGFISWEQHKNILAAAVEDSHAEFQKETLHTSQLLRLLTKIDELLATDHWDYCHPKTCKWCDVRIEIKTAYVRPTNPDGSGFITCQQHNDILAALENRYAEWSKAHRQALATRDSEIARLYEELNAIKGRHAQELAAMKEACISAIATAFNRQEPSTNKWLPQFEVARKAIRETK